MAIIVAGSGAPKSIVVDGILIVIKNGKSTSAKRATTNRAVTSNTTSTSANVPNPNFRTLDKNIMALDATYDMLPNQSDWETYALNIAGKWNLCANCEPDASGKKLFRQYNQNRLLIGAGTTTVPIDNTEFCDFDSDDLYRDDFGSGLQVFVGVPGSSSQDCYIIPSLGLSLQNPLGRVDAGSGNFGPYNPGSSLYDLVTFIINMFNLQPPGFGNTVIVPTCCFTTNGAPGKKKDILYARDDF